jgi:hypothetical protein
MKKIFARIAAPLKKTPVVVWLVIGVCLPPPTNVEEPLILLAPAFTSSMGGYGGNRHGQGGPCLGPADAVHMPAAVAVIEPARLPVLTCPPQRSGRDVLHRG